MQHCRAQWYWKQHKNAEIGSRRKTKRESFLGVNCAQGTEHSNSMKHSWSAVEVACIYASLCHMLHGKFQPETRCCWGVECASHQRGFPFPTPLSPFICCPDSLRLFCPTHLPLSTQYSSFLIWHTHLAQIPYSVCVQKFLKRIISKTSYFYADFFFIRHTQPFPRIQNICLISKHTAAVSRVPNVLDVSNRLQVLIHGLFCHIFQTQSGKVRYPNRRSSVPKEHLLNLMQHALGQFCFLCT